MKVSGKKKGQLNSSWSPNAVSPESPGTPGILDQVEDQDDWIHLLLLLSQPSTGGDGDETYDGN